jgi:hypothetical protein
MENQKGKNMERRMAGSIIKRNLENLLNLFYDENG